MRVSIPGTPLGSSRSRPCRAPSAPSCRTGSGRSRPPADRGMRRPRHRCSCMRLGRSGGLITYLAPSKPGLLVVVVGQEQVLRAGLGEGRQPAVARLGDHLERLGRREVHDVDGHVGHLGERDRAVRALGLGACGRVSAWYMGAVLPWRAPAARGRRSRRRSRRACRCVPPISPVLCSALKMLPSSTMNTPG